MRMIACMFRFTPCDAAGLRVLDLHVATGHGHARIMADSAFFHTICRHCKGLEVLELTGAPKCNPHRPPLHCMVHGGALIACCMLHVFLKGWEWADHGRPRGGVCVGGVTWSPTSAGTHARTHSISATYKCPDLRWQDGRRDFARCARCRILGMWPSAAGAPTTSRERRRIQRGGGGS